MRVSTFRIVQKKKTPGAGGAAGSWARFREVKVGRSPAPEAEAYCDLPSVKSASPGSAARAAISGISVFNGAATAVDDTAIIRIDYAGIYDAAISRPAPAGGFLTGANLG